MERKGSLPVREVMLISLAVVIMFLLIAGFQGWLDQIIGSFLGEISYPTP
jgi:peptidoglycan/LPS O-acetylase OafA/YrhL